MDQYEKRVEHRRQEPSKGQMNGQGLAATRVTGG